MNERSLRNVGGRLKNEVLGAFMALGVFGGTEGCSTNYRPTSQVADRHWLAEQVLQQGRDGAYTSEQITILRHQFQECSREATRLTSAERAAIDRRVNTLQERDLLSEAERTIDGTRIEHDWQQTTSASLNPPSWVRGNPGYDQSAQQVGEGRPRAWDYAGWGHLIQALEEHPTAAHQVHITAESVLEILHNNGAPDVHATNVSRINITDRFLETSEDNSLSSLAPSISERLGFERREESIQAMGYGSNTEASRIRAVADFMGIMRNKQIAIAESGMYFVNANTISDLSIERQSGVFYVTNIRFDTAQAENPQTQRLESRTVMTAEVLYYAPRAGHRLATDRVLRRPLFSTQE